MTFADASTMSLPAPAKLNLFLHVTGRRADGYHELESVFVPIDLADRVELSRRDDGLIRLLDPPADLDPTTELCCRAARELQRASGTGSGVEIRLHKRIPVGSGLGGGSSDAATTLLGLNRLWRLHWPRERLQRLALRVGADVPFFVFGEASFVRGIGEALQAVTLPSTHFVLAFPGSGVATADVFRDPALSRSTPGTASGALAMGHGRNDLQPVAERLEPAIAAVRAAMAGCGGGLDPPRMTGSGAAVFARAHHRREAERIADQLRHDGWQAWAVRSLARHPLRAFGDAATI